MHSIKLKDILLNDENHFVGMEYYFLILNRTYLVIKSNGYLIGIQANGLVAVEAGTGDLIQLATSKLAIADDLSNPYSYLKDSYLEKIVDLNLIDGSIVKSNKSNFLIKLIDIKSAVYNPSKKFGMGPYPHDGRVTIKTYDNKTREFIILGDQSGRNIVDFINRK